MKPVNNCVLYTATFHSPALTSVHGTPVSVNVLTPVIASERLQRMIEHTEQVGATLKADGHTELLVIMRDQLRWLRTMHGQCEQLRSEPDAV